MGVHPALALPQWRQRPTHAQPVAVPVATDDAHLPGSVAAQLQTNVETKVGQGVVDPSGSLARERGVPVGCGADFWFAPLCPLCGNITIKHIN